MTKNNGVFAEDTLGYFIMQIPEIEKISSGFERQNRLLLLKHDVQEYKNKITDDTCISSALADIVISLIDKKINQ